jgi:ligand-binding sensor domain-containing protein/two-component sensor histidine kinase
MRKLLPSITLLFALLIVAESAYPQIMPFRNYSIELGLSESVAHDILQDEKGYIWVATGYGLNRFDGNYFSQYYEEDGLANNRVHSLFQDSEMSLWIGTETGVTIFREDTLITPSQIIGLSHFAVLSIFEDRDGNFWFGTDGDGVWKLDREDRLEEVVIEGRFPIRSVRAIDQAPDGTIWLATREGVVKISDDEIRHYCDHDGLPDMRSRDVTADRYGRVWIGTRGGLVLFENGEFTVFDETHGINDPRIHTITVEAENRVWIGTENGVSLFDMENFSNYSRRHGLPATIIYASMVDREGYVWFGTLGGGITIFSGDIFHSYNIDNGLTNNVVTGFAEDEFGNIWIATYGGGIIRYDGETMTAYGEQDGLVDNKVYTIYPDRAGRLWIGAREGISIYENGTFTTLDQEQYPFTVVRKFYENDDTGDFWIATYNDGVFRLTDNGYEQFDTSNELLNNTVMDIKRDRNGDLWFATYGGAVRYDGENFHYITIADNLPSNGVIHIHVDERNDIWFSTFNGPAYYSSTNGTVERIIRSPRVETIYYFTEQLSENRYWFGTNRGLYLFKRDQFDSHTTEIERRLSYRIYTTNQGLIANELNAGASYVARDGSIWLGTVEGLSRFFPGRIRQNTVPPGLEFEEILISGRHVTPDREYRLQHDSNFLQATFNGLTYEAPEQVVYEYRLRGLNNEWTVTMEPSISYPALAPGDYRLEVRAYNADGIMSSRTATFSFTILPPFYFQAWFIILILLTIIGLFLFSLRYFRVTKQVDIEKMRVQIASDLHDDVGASLTELALQTDFLQAGELNPEVRETLKQIGEHSRKIVSSLDDIVWSIDSRNDTAGDLTDRMQDYVNQIFVNGQTDVFYHFDELKMDRQLPVDVKENIYLIFKESVNNVVKHSNASKVDIHFSFDGRSYDLLVQDNGTGSDKNRKTGQGLRNIRMRAERIGAEIEIGSDNGFRVRAKGTVQ